MKEKVLFICIHNSARSQMAEELLKSLACDRFEVESAGLEPGALNPFVVQALEELGIDISNKKTQSVKSLCQEGRQYDYVVTVCDEASAERCPTFPGKAKRLHWSFPDPSKFKGSDAEKLSKVRDILSQIKTKIEQWLSSQG